MPPTAKNSLLATFIWLATATLVQPATAAPTMQQQLQALQQTLEAQQAQLAKQQQQIEKLEQGTVQTKLAAQEQPKLSSSGSRPTLTSADGRSAIALRALVQLDAAHYSQAAPGSLSRDFRRGSVGATANRETDAAQHLSDGAYFRRARFGVEGTIARAFNYRLLMELGGAGSEGPTRINDAWIAYTGFAPFTVQMGAFAPPANLADGTTPDDLLFIERASSAELSRVMGGADGRLGIGLRGSGSRWMAALTLTSRTVNDAETFDSQSALVGRAGGLVATGIDFNVHLGVNGSYVLHPPDQGFSATSNRYGIRFRDRPELRVDSTRLIDTGTIDARHASATGVEFAANWRNWLLQAEDTGFAVDRRASSLASPRFNGYYLEGSWVLTGESHRYNAANASYQSPRPFVPFDGHDGWGAWELALRYSRTDLNFHAGFAGLASPADGIRGGEQSVTAAGVNWYPNQNLRLLVDFMHIKVDRLNPAAAGNPTPFGAAPATPPVGVNIGQNLNVFALRSQYAF